MPLRTAAAAVVLQRARVAHEASITCSTAEGWAGCTQTARWRCWLNLQQADVVGAVSTAQALQQLKLWGLWRWRCSSSSSSISGGGSSGSGMGCGNASSTRHHRRGHKAAGRHAIQQHRALLSSQQQQSCRRRC
jgi:hypothetical protein